MDQPPAAAQPHPSATPVAPLRPKGFTRAVRDFHRLLMAVQAEDLTPADRSALRALFRDLLLLARAPAAPTGRVFPPLPSNPPERSERRPRRTHARRARPT